MEYCDFGSLESLTHKTNLQEKYLREIASCCLLGMKHLHDHRIIHRVNDMSDNDCIGH